MQPGPSQSQAQPSQHRRAENPHSSSTTNNSHFRPGYLLGMASIKAMMRLPTSSIGLKSATYSRSFATSQRASWAGGLRPTSRILLQSKLQRPSCRGYADAPSIKVPKKRFRWFKFLWRVTYLSAIGGTAYLAYGVYELRHPEDQFETDPSKKNLVILGNNVAELLDFSFEVLTNNRYWLGSCISSQETRYRKL